MKRLQANFIYNSQPQRKTQDDAAAPFSHLPTNPNRITTLKAVQSHRTLLPFYTRAKRKALRITTPKAISAIRTQQDADQIVTDWLAVHDPLNDKAHYAQNVVDPDMDITGADEFGDIDNEHDGLTVTEPMDELEMIEFLTGYNVL